MYQFSIVIPCYNCKNTISATLQSIVDQHLGNKIEVVLVDDCSTEDFSKEVSNFKDKLNIYEYKTPRNLGVGGARQYGLDSATGDWVIFCDNDDTFVPNTFNRVRTIIRNNPSRNVIQTRFQEVEQSGNIIPYTIERGMNWIHGKFFKRSFLVDNDLTFKKGLETHEDIYFSILTRLATTHIGAPILECDLITYNWFNRPDSLSHARETGLDLFEGHFDDYVMSAFGPVVALKDTLSKDEKISQCLSVILFIYFYMEGFQQLGRTNHERDMKILSETIKKTCEICELTPQLICQIIYQNPATYCMIREKSFESVGPFFEFDSLERIILDTEEK